MHQTAPGADRARPEPVSDRDAEAPTRTFRAERRASERRASERRASAGTAAQVTRAVGGRVLGAFAAPGAGAACSGPSPRGAAPVCWAPDGRPDRRRDRRLWRAFAHAARFVSVDPAEHRSRFYELRLQETLWGGVALVRAWGRLGAPGRWTATKYPDRKAAGPAVARAVRRRLARGYRPVGVRCGPSRRWGPPTHGRGAASLISSSQAPIPSTGRPGADARGPHRQGSFLGALLAMLDYRQRVSWTPPAGPSLLRPPSD